MAKCAIKNGKYFAPNGEESKLFQDLSKVMSKEEASDMFVFSRTPSLQKILLESHRNKISKAPKNVTFEETNTKKIRTFHIFDNYKRIGRIQLVAFKEGFKVKSSLLNEESKGKGFGKHLYNHAIAKLFKEGKTLYSDQIRTESADRVWNSLVKSGLSEDGRTVKPLPSSFDENGDVKADFLIQYVADTLSFNTPLDVEEKIQLLDTPFEDSDELLKALEDAFYKDGLFYPQGDKLREMYLGAEVDNILGSAEIQGRIKETVERLRHTETFQIPQIEFKIEFDFRSLETDVIGRYKRMNPLRAEKEKLEESYPKIQVIDEGGNALETQMFFENAIKEPEERGLRAIVEAHPLIDTATLEKTVIEDFKKYGMNVEGLKRENFKDLLNYVESPTEENRKVLEDTLGFQRQPLRKPIKISPENRTYKYLRTSKSEEELFNELSLIQTDVPHVYHQVNKISEEEMRGSTDMTVPEYQLYKDYYNYSTPIQTREVQTNIESSVSYLLGDFIADFATQKPNALAEQFIINENGIELKSEDILTIETVKMLIEGGIKYGKEIADYSLISKNMPNLKAGVGTVNLRAQAVNNPNLVSKPSTEVTILDEESIHAPNETKQFLKIGEDIYEQQEQGYYNKLEVNNNPNFLNLSPKAPQFKDFKITQEVKAESKINKAENNEDFSCL